MIIVVVDNRTPLIGAKHSMTTKLIDTLTHTEDVELTVVNSVAAINDGIDFTKTDMLFISGSSMRLTNPHDIPTCRAAIIAVTHALKNNIPIVGICFGAQLLTWMMGGSVAIHPANSRPYFYSTKFGTMYFNHKDVITEAPPGFEILSRHAKWGFILTMWCAESRILLTQWHPEGSEEGANFLKTFIQKQKTFMQGDRRDDSKE